VDECKPLVAGVAAEVTIRRVDTTGTAQTAGATDAAAAFNAVIVAPQSARLSGKFQAPMDPTVSPEADGSVTLSFTAYTAACNAATAGPVAIPGIADVCAPAAATIADPYYLNVSYGTTPIAGSPFSLVLSPGVAKGTNSRPSGVPEAGFAGEIVRYLVDVSDAHGNLLHAPTSAAAAVTGAGGGWGIEVTGPTSAGYAAVDADPRFSEATWLRVSPAWSAGLVGYYSAYASLAGGVLRTSTRTTMNQQTGPQFYMSIHPEGTSCDRVLSQFERLFSLSLLLGGW